MDKLHILAQNARKPPVDLISDLIAQAYQQEMWRKGLDELCQQTATQMLPYWYCPRDPRL